MGRARALLTYSATRLGLAPLMLWLIASLVFLLLRLAPGDPVDAVLGSRAPAAAKAAMARAAKEEKEAGAGERSCRDAVSSPTNLLPKLPFGLNSRTSYNHTTIKQEQEKNLFWT